MNSTNIDKNSNVLDTNNFLLLCIKIFEKFNNLEKIVLTNKNYFFENHNVMVFNSLHENIIKKILHRQLIFIEKKKLNKIILAIDNDFELDNNDKNVRELIYNHYCYGIFLICKNKIY
jgi:hypothetical protein